MTKLWILSALSAAALSLGACDNRSAKTVADDSSATVTAEQAQLSAEQAQNLETFDDLDFRVYSGQLWDEFSKSHAEDIVVHYPDGTTTTGLDDHLEMLKPQFAFAPDTHIKEHPIKLADGEYTAVQGFLEGTFSEPMNLGDGKFLEPTGKSFRLPMLTVGRWKNGVMVEEWLYWDNAAFMAQITAE
ncbi:MAG: ester cyclase [Parvularculaceae bacterium]